MTVPNLSALKLELKQIIENHDKPAKLSHIENAVYSDNTGDVYYAGIEDGVYSLAKSLLSQYFEE